VFTRMGCLEKTATVIGLLGAGGLLFFVVLLLRPYELGFTVNAPATYRALWEQRHTRAADGRPRPR
jgi:hypothetical protein